MKSKEIKALERTIWELRKEAEFQTRRHVVECDRIKTEAKVTWLDHTKSLHLRLEAAEAKIGEVEKRWDNSIQTQQADLIKALCVKLPTVNIKEIHADCKGK